MDRLLPLEWRKSVAFVAGEKNVRHWLTSDSNHAPPAPIDGADEFGLIRQWVTGTGCAVADPERARRWGRRSVAIRQLLAAIGQAAMVSGSSVLEFGTRNLALHSGLSQRTVSRLLRFLCAEPDPLLDVVTRGRMARADRIALRIPDAYADSVRWRRRRAGRIDGDTPGVPGPRRHGRARPPGARRHRGARRRGGPGGPAEPLGDVGRAPGPGRARARRARPRRLAPRCTPDLDDGGHVDRGG